LRVGGEIKVGLEGIGVGVEDISSHLREVKRPERLQTRIARVTKTYA
jgi:hypothetical protein